jgi:hypothetical protein
MDMKSVYPAFLLLLILSGCSKTQNDGIPSYVNISNPILETTSAQGSALHDISTVWVESEGENFGAYEVPVTFPALVSGNRQIIVNAGIKQAGDFFIREIYPCYMPYFEDITFVQKDTVFVQPVFKYRDQVQFLLIESFENSNIFDGLDRTQAGNPNNLEGIAGFAELNEFRTSVDAKMGNALPIARQGRTFIELHYKGTNDFAMGVEAFEGGASFFSNFFAIFEPSQTWRKIYIEITNLLNNLDGDEYKFYFRAGLLPGLDEADIYIDNFKIVKL